MSGLFLDTTDHLVFGLFDDKYNWISHKELDDKKSSKIIHGLINEEFELKGKSLDELETLVQINGPGSYTGMRVSDGIAQVFEWSGAATYNLYHFDIPKIIGIEKFVWFSNAFKSEFFVYSYNCGAESRELLSLEELDKRLETESEIFTHFPSDSFCYKNLKYTGQLMKDNAPKILSFVINNKQSKELFYYRKLEDEFSVSKK